MTRFVALFLAGFAAACTPLLDADFDALPLDASMDQGVVDLPGAPTGDRMIVLDGIAPGIFDMDGFGDGRHLQVQRNVLVGDAGGHSQVHFVPVAAEPDQPIFFTWRGEIAGFAGQTPPVVAAKLKNLVGPNQPNLFSIFIIRLSAGAISVQPQGGLETSVGFGVEGPHTVILRVDPDGDYALSVVGDGVNPGGGFTHEGNLGSAGSIDPENIGLTLTFDDENGPGPEFYKVDNLEISERSD